LPERDTELHGVESAWRQVANVPVQLPSSSAALQALLVKVSRLFVNFLERIWVKRTKPLVWSPSMSFCQPFWKRHVFAALSQMRVVAKMRRVARRWWIELEHRDIGELVAIQGQKFVVENAPGVTWMGCPKIQFCSGWVTVCGGRPLISLRRASWRRLAWGSSTRREEKRLMESMAATEMTGTMSR